MTQLPTNRTAAGNSIQEHVDDHNTLAIEHNGLDGHAAATTSVHGITDSSTLIVTSDSRLSDTRTPTDGTVTDAKVAANAAIAKSKLAALAIVDADVDAAAAIAESKLALASDAAAGTASRRTLGTGATQAAAGPHAHSGTYESSGTVATHEAAADPHTGYLKESDVSGLATPAVVLGTAAAAGSATTASRSDSTIVAFDATAPTTQAFSDAAAVGAAAVAARRDHKHAMPADPVTAHAAAADPHTGYVLESLLDAKGDLIAASADNTPAKLTVGTNGRGLVADSTATPGVAWGGPMSLRDLAFLPTGAVAETISRASQINTASTLVSGTIYLQAIALPAGAVISSISFVNGGTAAGTPTNWWFGLYDLNRNQLAVTADQLTAAWAGNTLKTLAIATTAGGAASTFTTTYAGLHYLGFMMKAATPVNLSVAVMASPIYTLTPLIYGNSSSTSQTVPQAFPFQAGAMSALQGVAYAYVS